MKPIEAVLSVDKSIKREGAQYHDRKKERALRACEVLERIYPEALCALHYQEPYQLLIAVRLSAQCTDARVNLVTPTLFQKYPTLQDFADADISELESVVKPCGFYRMKAKNIKEMAEQLLTKYHGVVPGYHGGIADTIRRWQKNSKLDSWRCVRQACHCRRHTFYSNYRTAWTDEFQGSGTGGTGSPPVGTPRALL